MEEVEMWLAVLSVAFLAVAGLATLIRREDDAYTWDHMANKR
jgi:hypothetical protein